MDELKCDKLEQYTSDDLMDDLEQIRAVLRGAKQRINRSKLENTDINIHIAISL